MPSRHFHTSPAGSSSRGFVQLLVLISLAGIAAIVTASMATARANNQAAPALERTIEIEALSTSAFRRISQAIASPTDDLELQMLASEVPLDVFGTSVGMSIESEAGKVNLMLADLAVVRRYLANAGLPIDETDAVVDAVERARGAGDRRQALDALAIGLFDRRSLAELLEDVTVFGTMAEIDPTYATSRTLASVPDLSPAQIAQLQAAAPPDRASVVQSAYFSAGGTRYSLVATIRWGNDQVSRRRLVVELTRTGQAVPVAVGY